MNNNKATVSRKRSKHIQVREWIIVNLGVDLDEKDIQQHSHLELEERAAQVAAAREALGLDL